METFSETESGEDRNISDENHVIYSKLKQGYLKCWIQEYSQRVKNKKMSFSVEEKISSMFMIAIMVRILKVITITDMKDRILIYLGSPWSYLGGNNSYIETILLMWTINYMAFNLFIIHSKRKHYKWLEIFEFLAGIIPYKDIGINKLINFFRNTMIYKNNLLNFSINRIG
jgi:hypothetical protein